MIDLAELDSIAHAIGDGARLAAAAGDLTALTVLLEGGHRPPDGPPLHTEAVDPSGPVHKGTR